MSIIFDGNKIIETKILDKGFFLSEVERKIIDEIVKGKKELVEIAKSLGRSKQVTWYYIKKLREKGIIKEKRRSGKKVEFDLVSSSISFILNERNWTKCRTFEESPIRNIFYPIITDNGEMDGYIVVGSVDVHGPYRARARDLYYSAYISFLLGKHIKFVKDLEFVKLDINIISENKLGENLILIGGPVVNIVTNKINEKLPVRFESRGNWVIFSEISGKTYYEENIGVILKANNPFNYNKKVIIFAGIRAHGTFTSILFLIKDKIKKFAKNENFYYILSGEDIDGDGKIDEITVLEEGRI